VGVDIDGLSVEELRELEDQIQKEVKFIEEYGKQVQDDDQSSGK